MLESQFMKKLLRIIVMVLLLNTGVFAQCNEKYGKTLCVPPGGNEVLAKGKVIIQKLIKGENVDVDSYGSSKKRVE